MIEIPGYSHGSTQPVCVIGITVSDDLDFDYGLVDDFLENAFLVSPLPFDTPRDGEDRLRAIIDRLSFLANSLLQAIKIPAFQTAQIADVHHDAKNRAFRVRLLAPTVANIPQDLILNAHGLARKILAEIRPDYDFEAAFQKIDADFVKKYKAQVPGGISTISVLQGAFKRQIPFSHLGAGIYQLGWGCRSRRFDRSATDRDTAIGSRISSDKRLTNQVLLQAGFPATQQIAVRSAQAAVKAGQELDYPVVLKPAQSERGEGVTVDIVSDEQLLETYVKTQKIYGNLLVEKQVSGLCHRIFVADKKVRHIIARHPMHVMGDGVSSIRDLAEIENGTQDKLPLHRRRPKLEINETSLKNLSRFDFNADSIPPKGLRVPFQRLESVALGGIAEDVMDVAHPDNIALAEEIADFCGLDSMGLDIISDDLTQPWHQNGARVNEVNFAPMLSPYRNWVRDSVESFLEDAIPGQGRIPIALFAGGDAALAAARRYQDEMGAQGKAHFLCSGEVTIKPNGETGLDDLGNSLFLRAHALILNRSVEGLVCVVQDESILQTGFPFDSVSHKVRVDDAFQFVRDKSPLGTDTVSRINAAIDQVPLFAAED